ncbi:MAG TPA: preprotein translocase subunit YajC [Rhodospirillaceae bacterium]|nr:preprotein translocase subunit YajC [Rhodospirillaceae bacterium]
MLISEAYAQAAAAPGAGGMSDLSQFMPLVLIFVVFYFMLIRPQQKKAKQHREMVMQLRRGDRVLTQGGIIGQINKVISDSEVSVEISEGVRVRVMRAAIAEVLAKTEPVAASKDSAAAGDAEPEASTTPSAPVEEKKSSPFGGLFGKK